jgi:hypothetical protein
MANDFRDSHGYHVYVLHVATLANFVNAICYAVVRLLFVIFCGEKSLGKAIGGTTATTSSGSKKTKKVE